MLPSILAKQLQQGLSDYIETTFPMTNPAFQGSLKGMLETPNAVFREPYVAVRLPFRAAEGEGEFFDSLRLPFRPYVHQEKAFARLTGCRSTLIATGTGSGKTECFLYPLLEYCWQHQEERGIKGILIYPMNALASDQAARTARLIYHSPELRGNVTVGMYVGGIGRASRAMGEESVITDREAMRANPPDILITNYKMLDYLLIRPADRPIWAENRPETLKYVVVDELHTFDGAQGTDLACLLRRLKARLDTPKGWLCCVGASATMGGRDSAQGLLEFGEKIFGEPFDQDALVMEDRLSPLEFFAGREPEDFTLPARTEELSRLAGEDDEEAYLRAAAAAWLERPGDLFSPEGRLELGQKLMGHSFCQSMLALMDGGYVQVSPLCRQLAGRWPGLEELSDPAAAVNGLLALISHARSGTPDRLRPFLDVQVQLWFRELSRLEAKVDREISFALSADLGEEQAGHYLPVVNCRDCGETGWASLKNERGGVGLTDLNAFYNLYFRCDSKVIMMFPHSYQDTAPGGMARGNLCPDCLRLNVGEKESGLCRTCGKDRSIPVLFPAAPNVMEGRNSRQFVCPFCGSRRGLTLVGARGVTEISAGISQFFASRFNDDKKTLAFTDNVQDAAHHAGFFNDRTWRFGLRGAVQRYAQDGGDGRSLEEFQRGFVDYWRGKWSPEEFVSRLIAPNMVWMQAYEDMTRTGALGKGRLEEKLLRDVGLRSEYEILLEYGLSSRRGRTLEKAGCSTLAFRRPEVERVAALVRERVENELSLLSEAAQEQFVWMTLGFLDILRRNGGFDDPAFHLYSATGKAFDLSNNRKTKRDWMPGVQSGRNTPRFLYVPGRPGRRVAAFDLADSRRYTQWISRCAGPLLAAEENLKHIARIVFEELRRAGLVVRMPGGEDFTVWALSRRRVFVTTQVTQLACGCCGTTTSAAGEDGALWTGAPCPRAGCPGRLQRAPDAPLGYYHRLYSAGDLVRVEAREHTGLLKRADRQELERSFQRGGPRRRPWDPNVLSCTPTLEMGIDIGDLSTVVLCGIPPAQPQFLQRAGRAGRKDGNALTLAVAAARPHDLYFYAEPLDMIAGGVKPPVVFLQAAAVLQRQFVAYGMDCWLRRGADEKAVPDTVQTCLAGADKRDLFPYNYLGFVEHNRDWLFRSFVELFSPQAEGETARELMEFVLGDPWENSPMYQRVSQAFAGLRRERDARSAELRDLGKMIRELEGKPKDSSYDQELQKLKGERRALADVVRQINHKNVFNFLSDEGLLPNYAFPEAGISLKAVLRRQEEGGQEAQSWQRIVREYSRPAASAIGEFAPGNSFYAEGRRLTIDQVDLTAAKTELWRLCPNCSYARLEAGGGGTASCPRCGSPAWADAGQLRPMLKVRMVYSSDSWKDSLIGGESDGRTETFYNRRIYVDVDESRDVERAYRIETGDFPFGYEFVRRAVLREINFGERDLMGERLMVAGAEEVRRGFQVCRYCGKLQPASGRARHTFTCRARDLPEEEKEPWTQRLFLYREFTTEALRILIPATTMDLSTVRQESLTAAFLLGMKECFGNVDHLRAVISEAPVAGTVFRKQYLVVYDCIPGGTGYLRQLVQRKQALVEVFARALRVLETCSCRDDPQKDGCYHCLYAYRQSGHMNQISRRAAIGMLKAIVSGRDRVEEIPALDSIPMRELFESELERRFIQALYRVCGESGPLQLVKALVNGKEGLRIKAGGAVWEVESQVFLEGTPAPCRADFVLWPVRGGGDRRPVAVFTDGFLYHKDRAADDTRKREALVLEGRFRVWVLSWKDVQSVFQPQGGYAAPTLLPQAMPAGAQMYRPTLAGEQALPTDRLSPMELLVKYLELDRAEELFQLHAKAYAFSLLEPGKRRSTQDFAQWRAAADPISQALWGRPAPREDAFFGTWRPGEDSLEIYAGVSAQEMKVKKTQAQVFVSALLRDGREDRTERYESQWNGFWQFFNVMQFLGSFGAVTETGLAQGVYGGLMPREEEPAAPRQAGAWGPLLEDMDAGAAAMADRLMAMGVPAPSCVGYELADSSGAVAAQAELAWERERVVYLLPDQEAYRPAFEAAGWTVLTDGGAPEEIWRGGRS